MGLYLQNYRAKPDSVGNDHTPGGSLKSAIPIVIAKAKYLFIRLFPNVDPIHHSPTEATVSNIDETPRPFIAKENLKHCDDVVVFGDELYKWRSEFNVRPTFIALRNIERGEEVVSNPTDFEKSDLLVHWGLTYKS